MYIERRRLHGCVLNAMHVQHNQNDEEEEKEKMERNGGRWANKLIDLHRKTKSKSKQKSVCLSCEFINE